MRLGRRSVRAVTVQVAINDALSPTASNFTTVITSTIGTFSSTNLYEGAVALVALDGQTPDVPTGGTI